MFRLLALALVASMVMSSAPARAETLMYDYFSLLGPMDAHNSRGQRLDDICAIAQQDRANWHRFNKREDSDGGDFFFTTAERRSLFSRRCQADAGYYANAGNRIRSGTRSFYVYVRVFGTNGRVSRIVITEGAG